MTLTPEATILWETAKALTRTIAPVSLPPLLFLTDPLRTPFPWETAARLPPGAGVIYRHFGGSDAVETAKRLREATARQGVRLLISLDVELAERVEADGLHLPERALHRAGTLRSAKTGWLLTGAWHGELSPDHPVDALILSPVFPAGGTSRARKALGRDGFDRLAAVAGRPVYALGGLNTENAGAMIGTRACGIAGVSAIKDAFR